MIFFSFAEVCHEEYCPSVETDGVVVDPQEILCCRWAVSLLTHIPVKNKFRCLGMSYSRFRFCVVFGKGVSVSLPFVAHLSWGVLLALWYDKSLCVHLNFGNRRIGESRRRCAG